MILINCFEYQLGLDICKQEGCHLLDYYYTPDLVATKEYFEYFNDSYHLNDFGETEFTRIIANQSNYVAIQCTDDNLQR